MTGGWPHGGKVVLHVDWTDRIPRRSCRWASSEVEGAHLAASINRASRRRADTRASVSVAGVDRVGHLQVLGGTTSTVEWPPRPLELSTNNRRPSGLIASPSLGSTSRWR